jgi:glycosyltransferase involved in cell wall biosynthesis
MKILHVLAQRPGKTGSGIYLQSIIEEADRKNYKQAVVVGIPQNDDAIFKSHIKIFPVIFETKELPFPVAGMSNVMPYPSTCYCDLTESMAECWKRAFSEMLDRAIENFKPDIILSHHLWLLSVLTKEKFPHIPLIAIAHGTGLRQMVFAEQFTNYVKSGCQKIDLILSLNHLQKKLISEKYQIPPEKIIVNGSGYNSSIFYSSHKPYNEIVKIVFAGKLSPSKGIYSFLRAITNIKLLNLQIIIIGTSNHAETSRIYEMTADMHHPVIFTGNLPQPELADYFREGDIFVLPSFYEGLPLVIIEAIACHMRVVVNDLPGIKEFLGNALCSSGMLSFVKLPRLKNVDVPIEADLPDYEAELEKAIEQQIENVVAAHPIPIELTDKIVQEWSWEKLFGRIEKQIKKLL